MIAATIERDQHPLHPRTRPPGAERHEHQREQRDVDQGRQQHADHGQRGAVHRQQAVIPIAAMTNRTACMRRRCGGDQRAEQERAPHHEAEPRCILDQRGDDGDRCQRQRNGALGQEIFAVMQPGNLSRVVRRPEHHVGEQQQLERYEVSEPQCREHEAEMRSVGDAHRHFPQPDDRSIRADSGTVAISPSTGDRGARPPRRGRGNIG